MTGAVGVRVDSTLTQNSGTRVSDPQDHSKHLQFITEVKGDAARGAIAYKAILPSIQAAVKSFNAAQRELVANPAATRAGALVATRVGVAALIWVSAQARIAIAVVAVAYLSVDLFAKYTAKLALQDLSAGKEFEIFGELLQFMLDQKEGIKDLNEYSGYLGGFAEKLGNDSELVNPSNGLGARSTGGNIRVNMSDLDRSDASTETD